MLATLRANIALTLVSILAAILLAICVYQGVVINGFLWIDGLKDQIADCARDRNELRAIAKAKDEQGETTRGNIERAETNEREGRKIADTIRAAPIPPNCETPGLDIMRNEL